MSYEAVSRVLRGGSYRYVAPGMGMSPMRGCLGPVFVSCLVGFRSVSVA